MRRRDDLGLFRWPRHQVAWSNINLTRPIFNVRHTLNHPSGPETGGTTAIRREKQLTLKEG